jgi:hypothetical protein
MLKFNNQYEETTICKTFENETTTFLTRQTLVMQSKEDGLVKFDQNKKRSRRSVQCRFETPPFHGTQKRN